MTLWDISGMKVKLDVRDLGGHLDFTFRAGAGALSERRLQLVLLLLVLYFWVSPD